MLFDRIFGSRALEIGSKAPDFSLPNESGESVKLSDFRGQWVVLFFYPKDFSAGCTAEVCSFRDHFDDFSNLGATVLGINTDTVDSHQKFKNKHNLPFSLLADTTGETSKNYGVLLFGKISNRETFFVSPDGQIKDRLSWVNWFSYAETVRKRLEELKKEHSRGVV